MAERNLAQNYKLRDARELKGWTQKDVADKIQLPDPRTYRRWESGSAIPSLRYRSKLCEEFAMSPDELGFSLTSQLHLIEKAERYLSATVTDPNETEYVSISTHQSVQSSGMLVFEPSLLDPERWNRQRFLEKIWAFWIKKVLDHAFDDSFRIALRLHIWMDVVTHPHAYQIQISHQGTSRWQDTTSLMQIYDESCGELLILGSPGSGKTILLLELARELLQRAASNQVHPMPVIFNLASWDEKRLPLAAWMIEELQRTYHIPQRTCEAWIENEHILPLLDGFDEVCSTVRRLCLNAINTYKREHGLVSIVVCSRKEEYLDLGIGLSLQRAISIEPLDAVQIDAALAMRGSPLNDFRQKFHANKELQPYMTTPLILKTVIQTYQYQTHPLSQERDLATATDISRSRGQLFASYVGQMLDRRKSPHHYSAQQSIRWLAWQAQQMKRRNETEFHLERLQFDDLPTMSLQQISYGLWLGLWTTPLAGGILGAISMALRESLTHTFILIVCTALAVGMVAGLIGTQLSGQNTKTKLLTSVPLLTSSVLRLLLWIAGYIPWYYRDFLQYAVACTLLCKANGGYRFTNHLLFDYFAALDNTVVDNTAQRQQPDLIAHDSVPSYPFI